jgi:catechol 2,3-dioxygenase-like lactoylglutathione lyase family enzyme
MHVLRLDHATINTRDLKASLAFYEHFLGMKPGFRPRFGVGGAWLYPEGGDYPIVHLIETKDGASGGMFDHVAFRGRGLAAYLAKIKASGAWYRANPVPETALVQIQHHDPNQVMIEINFENEPIAEADIRN